MTDNTLLILALIGGAIFLLPKLSRAAPSTRTIVRRSSPSSTQTSRPGFEVTVGGPGSIFDSLFGEDFKATVRA